ncbi:MAG: hypothetical protein WCH99_22365 [Verrucomicrobiota bacterium]
MKDIQTPFAPFVHPKLPLAGSLQTATNWVFAGERARPVGRSQAIFAGE